MTRLMLSAVLLASTASAARAGCGAANCPADMSAAVQAAEGSRRYFELGYELEYVPQDRVRVEASPASVGQVRGHHDEVYSISRTHRLKAVWAPSARWAFEIQLPYVSRSHQHVHHHQGKDLTDTWNVSGVGNPRLSARPVIYDGETRAGLIAGVKLPWGRHRAANDDGDTAEAPIQPATRSTDWILGMSATRRLGPVPVFGSFAYRWNGRGDEGYRLGDVFQANAGSTWPVWGGLSVMGQANLRVNREDDRGSTREEVGKTGGVVLYLSPGIHWRARSGFGAWGLLQLPVYQRVQSIQLVSAYNLLAGLSWRWTL